MGFGSFGLHLLTAGMFGWIYPIAVALMPAALLVFGPVARNQRA